MLVEARNFIGEAMNPNAWDRLEAISGLLVNVSVLIAAVAAVVKFRLYNLLGHRWRSELACKHHEIESGGTVFTADYTVHNTGQRPIRISDVTLRVVGAKAEGTLLVPDETRVVASRICRPDDPELKGLFQIEPGERAIFTLRSLVERLDDFVFVLCKFQLMHNRVPAAYRGFYAKVKEPPPVASTGAAA